MKPVFRIMLVGLVILPLLVTGPALAGQPERPAQEHTARQPLATLLNPDGTLNLGAGFSGSLDASGWRLASGAGEEPRFTRAVASPRQQSAPAAAGDEYWDNEFLLGVYDSSLPGNTSVFAIAVSGTDVYIGGDFDQAGDVMANRIAKWDGAAHKWHTLGSGMDSRVLAIAASGDDIYVGGNFQHAGGIAAHYIAHWNDATQTWSALAGELTHTSTSPEVDAIAIAASGDVYVGGEFEAAGGVTVNNIARWDGGSWHALGSGTGGTSHEVDAIAVSGADVYIGGGFTNVGGALHNHVARWNGSTWLGLGSGANDAVLAIATSGSNIYIGGEFSTVTDGGGTYTAGHVAMWTGSVWNTMAGGVGNPDVTALAVGSNGVYVGGRFIYLADGSTAVNRVARWDGSAWHNVGGATYNIGGGVDDNVYALAYSSAESSIYSGGFLSKAGSRLANQIARWSISAGEWYALGNSVNNPVYAMAMDGDSIYLGGSFNSAGGLPAHGIAVWNSKTRLWSALGGGLTGCSGGVSGCIPAVYAILVTADQVVVGGNFTTAGGVAASRIAAWDKTNSTWSAFGNGVYGCSGIGCSTYVQAITPSTYYGYITGGKFDTAGSGTVNNIAYYLTGWLSFGSGMNGTVYDIVVPGSYEMYAGGAFTTPANHLAYWDGGNWSSLSGGSPNDNVYALALSSTSLYAGGVFVNLGGANGDYVARYDLAGHSWQVLGAGLNNPVYSLAYDGSTLYAGGDFTASGVTGMNRVARFSGGQWSGLGSGVDSTVQAVGYDQQYVYVSGNFLNAGGKPSSYFGRWRRVIDVFLPAMRR